MKILHNSQNYWQLALIQSAAFGFPVLLVGTYLGKRDGLGSALISIWIGNLINWIVAIASIAMTMNARENAIGNFKEYLGKYTGIVSGIVLSFAFLLWYPIQLKDSIKSIEHMFPSGLQGYQNLSIGIGLGLFIALLAKGGIRLIKYFNVIAFLILIIILVYAVFKNPSHQTLQYSWGISISGITMVSATWLVGAVNLPTFFRHARSPADGYLGLSLLVFLTMCIETLGIFLEGSGKGVIFPLDTQYHLFLKLMDFAFVALSLICVNLVNIYFSSAAWDSLIPGKQNSWRFTILGVLGTMVLIPLHRISDLNALESLFSTYIALLGIVICMGYFIRLLTHHRPRIFERGINSFCWIVSCVIAIVFFKSNSEFPTTALLSKSIAFSIFVFILAFFFEECVWSFRRIFIEIPPKNRR